MPAPRRGGSAWDHTNMGEGSRSETSAADSPAAGAVGDRASETPKPSLDPAAVALGRKGGLKGGKARAAKLSPERRSEIARNAARARWQQGQ